jgi:hypothetical protein
MCAKLQNTGTEQHRHHAVEIALYNMYSILTEIETGTVYRMTKANDIYSGLGQQDRLLEPRAAAATDSDGNHNNETNEEAADGQEEKKDLVDTLAEECEAANAEEPPVPQESATESSAELPTPPPVPATDAVTTATTTGRTRKPLPFDSLDLCCRKDR